jgi:hypothetical protein
VTYILINECHDIFVCILKVCSLHQKAVFNVSVLFTGSPALQNLDRRRHPVFAPDHIVSSCLTTLTAAVDSETINLDQLIRIPLCCE